jgi:GT2 family glycosyltransferase
MTDGDGQESDESPEVSIVVLAYRQVERLDTVLGQLRDHESLTTREVVVVANDVPGAVSGVLDRHGWVRRVDSRVNRGFGGGCNLGARHARGELLLFLNDDARIGPGWLDSLVAVARRHPEVSAVASALVHEGVVLEAGGAANLLGDVWPPDRGRTLRSLQGRGPCRVSYATGGSLLVRAAAFESVDGFDLAYHPAYFEDTDLSCRLWAAGHEVWSVTSSHAEHAESASTAGAAKRALQIRNGSIFRGRWVAEFHRSGAPVYSVGDDLQRAATDRVLFVDDRVPAPGVGSGAARARQNVLAIAEAGFDVVLHPREPADAVDPELALAGVELAHDLEAVPPGSVEAVVVSRPHNYELWDMLRSRHPDARFVYDAEARFSARLEKQLDLGLTDDATALEAELREMIELETTVVRAADAVVTISVDELPWFQRAGAAQVHWVDPMPDRLLIEPQQPRDSDRAVFVAGWEAGADSPNGDAVRWLATQIVPVLRDEGSSCVIEVTGGNPPEALLSLESDHLRFVGRIDDLDEFHRGARIAIAPTRYGAGVKLKVLDALRCATPVVATTTGAEGIAPAWRDTITVTDDSREFAMEMVRLLGDDDAWCAANTAMCSAAGTHRADAAGSWRLVLGDARTTSRHGG